MYRIVISIFIILFSALSIKAEKCDTMQKKGNIIQQFIAYLDDTNKEHEDKAFDFSVIGGPHYSSDKGFGLGLVAAGLYKTDRSDPELQPSNVSIYFNGTTGMYFDVGIEGLTIFPHDRQRLTYLANFKSFDTKFWGIGYAMDANDANESKYKYLKSEISVNYTFRFAPSLYAGPLLQVDYVKGRDFENRRLWEGQASHSFSLGVGATLRYDSRDIATGPTRGLYIAIDQRFCPRFLGNSYAFSGTKATIADYQRLWKGAVMATVLVGDFTYGDTPWGLLPTFGGSNHMRGYYEGRYQDKCMMAATLELRQRVWKRSGAVAWIGAGTVFAKFRDMRLREFLPNWGIGYRWEFKRGVNIRLDYGFGRHCSGFIFSINEAF